MVNFKIVFISILELAIPFLLLSQNQLPKLNFQQLSYEDGLGDDREVPFIYQDSKGFVWISSIDGVNRFDGHQIKNYRFESGMKDKNIQSDFYEDGEENIWFSTYKSVNCYHRKLDSILTYQVKDTLGNIISNEYKVFYLDTFKKRLWLRADQQIFGVDILQPTNYFSLPTTINAYDFQVVTDHRSSPTKIIASPWLGSGIDILYIEDSLLLYHRKHLSEFQSLRKSVILSDSLWLFFNSRNIVLFDEQHPNKIRYLKNPKGFSFWEVSLYKEDYLIISTAFNGLWLYNWRTEEYIKEWKHQAGNQYSLATNNPKDLHLLSDHLWLYHTNNGVNYSYLYNNEFAKPIANILSPNVEITSINDGQNKSLLVATNYDGIYQLSQHGEILQHYQFPLNDNDATEIWHAITNEIGEVICTTSKAIYILDANSKNVKQILKYEEGLTYRFISQFYPNRMVVSTDKKIVELIKNEEGMYRFEDCSDFPEYDEIALLQFFQTSKGKLYVPYYYNELWIYDVSFDGVEILKEILCDIEFYNFFESKKHPNTVWAGSSKGLMKIINDTIVEKVMPEDAILSNINTYSVVEDLNGCLWVGTNQGLYKYDEEAEGNQLTQYNEIDGLASDLFSLYNCGYLAPNGDVWMGTNKGLVKFNPNEIKPYPIPPKVYIDELLINDTDLVKGIGEKDTLNLTYENNTLNFDVLAINLYKADQNQIKYRLKGYEQEWLQVNSQQRIRYTKIPPGKYTFEVQALDVNGNTSEIKKLQINIQPPFWQTWWFYALCTLAIALIIYGVYQYRLRQILQEEEKKRALEKLKTQLLEVEMKALRAQMNPHFLFNSMNSIKGLISQKNEVKAAEYLTKFSALLRSILSNSEKKKIRLDKEIEALKLYIELESLRFTKDFNYQIQIDKNIDTSFTRIPPLVLQPFVENAIWHGLLPKESGSNKLNINIYGEGDFVILEIEDNGVGRKNGSTPKKKNHQSMGIGITQKRTELLHPENEIRIIDLVDNNGKPKGTKVSVKLFAPE